ncbi:MAG: bifunctional helix-turn-helix transcriptional regulator/GNAT family N-acetyltransferase [Acidobacteria bacterium]|nr:bifunctional helix-turn-helix transcriptional regulator/GNAT family N-acetyltransferase [Acidobacteriota bacterium]
MARSATSSKEAHQIAVVRDFNRFYTARLGLLRRRHLDGEFSLTEARILYEIGTRPKTTASTLSSTLGLDAGYLSRLLAQLTKRKLIRQTASRQDGRERLLTLAPAGETAVARLNEQYSLQIRDLLSRLGSDERELLVQSLSKVRSILSPARGGEVKVVRISAASDEALNLLHEYYEAVSVVQRDTPQAIEAMISGAASGLWLAYLDGEPVGCVALKPLPSFPQAAECKRLYVRPSARGNRIADKLLDAMEQFARDHGLRWIYLDSYDGLKAAIALYRKRGYVDCERYNDNPQATVFLRKELGATR